MLNVSSKGIMEELNKHETLQGKTNCMYDACASQLSEAEKAKIGIHTGADLREKTVETFIANPALAKDLFQTADRLSFIKPDALKVGGSAMSVTADGMLLADKWLKKHLNVQGIFENIGKGDSTA